MARILVLGGTAWLGSEIARVASALGHEVTCLARGEAGAVPPGATLVRADREQPGAYDALEGEWDDVIEVSWQPRFVGGALDALGARAAHWTYVSSISAYADDATPGQDEDAPLLESLTEPTATPADYGRAKVACERMSRAAVEGRLLVSRPGLIAGPGDRSDRFGYWVSRFALADDGPVLVPLAPDQASQVIDVRDVAEWVVNAGERGVTGTLNTVGTVHSLDGVIARAAEAAGFRGRLVSAPESWLAEHGVDYWTGERALPLWLPGGGDYEGHGRRSNQRYVAAGGRLRDLDAMLADTLADERERGLDRTRKAGLSRTDELALIEEFETASPG
ncbi:MAG: NAD-dependent epimerase/dehydratase family protein [Rhodoglobus sp.]